MKNKIWLTGAIVISITIYYFLFIQNMILDTYSSTLLAFSYQEVGFGSRFLMGSIFKVICSLFPSLDSPIGASMFCFGCSLIFDITLIWFLSYMSSKFKSSKAQKGWLAFSNVLMIILVPSFSLMSNLGKPDALILALTIIQTYLLMESKHEWVVPVISVINALFHEGYLFMVAAVPISILLYKAMKDDKYWKLFWINTIITVLATGILMLVKTPYNLAIYDTVKEHASQLSFGGVYADYMLDQRFGRYTLIENIYHSSSVRPWKQIPYFIMCFLPLGIELFRLIKNIYKKESVNLCGFVIIAILVSVQYVMFCDYGRYVAWTIFCIGLITAYLCIEDEGIMENNFQNNMLVYVIPAVLCSPLMSNDMTFISVWFTR